MKSQGFFPEFKSYSDWKARRDLVVKKRPETLDEQFLISQAKEARRKK